MAVVKPFRALRYAQPAPEVTAPPYDVISEEERERLRALDPYNVVHLTLPDSDEDAARLLREWQEQGTLVRDEEPAVWVVEQDYVGPDGVARTRTGIVASLRAEPYDTGAVLPHERTHAGPKEGRLRLLRATGVQLEPIFLLYDGPAPLSRPDRPADLEADGTRVWRLEEDPGDYFADRELLIADGHHRYETTQAYGDDAHILVVLVSTEDPGLTIFPTHRVFEAPRRLEGEREPVDGDPLDAVDRGVVEVTPEGASVVRVPHGMLDVELVDTLGHDGIAYTPDAEEAVRRVREGEAAVAYLVRPAAVDDVFERARRGEVMPQKTTYFFPKLISGLFFHPL
jgi:uncharacterized protein (DUF1015 family)